MLKKCTKCGEEKGLDNFQKNRQNKGCGLRPRCKNCDNQSDRKRYETRGENCRELKRADRKQNGEQVRATDREKYKKNPKIKIDSAKKWYINNWQKGRESRRKWFSQNKGKMNEYRKQKILSDPKFKLRCNMGSSIWACLKKNKAGRHWETLVGYTVQDLTKHLEKQFAEGMSWENHGQWHIDHIVPIAAFNFSSPEHIDFKRCWALSNLRPLWAKENLQKNARLDKPFQPALGF